MFKNLKKLVSEQENFKSAQHFFTVNLYGAGKKLRQKLHLKMVIQSICHLMKLTFNTTLTLLMHGT